MVYEIQDIEGIGPTYGDKLREAGIRTTADFLKLCCDPNGRRTVAERTGVSERLILRWVNHADLMRIAGIGPQYAELLEAAGVDTVKELRHRNPDNLTVRLTEINRERRLAGTNPASSMVFAWIEEAQGIEPTITY